MLFEKNVGRAPELERAANTAELDGEAVVVICAARQTVSGLATQAKKGCALTTGRPSPSGPALPQSICAIP